MSENIIQIEGLPELTTSQVDKLLARLHSDLCKDAKLRNNLGRCPVCKSNIKDRTIALYEELVQNLYKVYRWCGEKNRHEFETKEIRHLLSKNAYARFGDFVRFGGIVYRPKDEKGNSRKAWFGINMQRAKEFYHKQRQIPVWIVINQLTGEIVDSKYVSVTDFPKLIAYLDDHGLYDHERRI